MEQPETCNRGGESGESRALMKAFVGPLMFMTSDGRTANEGTASAQDVLKYLCAPDASSVVDAVVARHREITEQVDQLLAVPADHWILTRMVWPLRYAVGSYMVGNFVGTIALCGLVAEAFTVLLFESCEVRLGQQPLDGRLQRELLGREFGELTQERRINILGATGRIDSKMRSWFHELRGLRNKYIHPSSGSWEGASTDARKAFDLTMLVVLRFFPQLTDQGSFAVDPGLMRYLKDHGCLDKAEQP
jgi:hypothetical protein